MSAVYAALVIPVILVGLAAANAEATFKPIHVKHTGGFRLAMPPERAIELFTGPGERSWVPGWDPTVLSGDGTEMGTVFVTSDAHSTTVWVVVDYDTEALRARYARATPGVKACTVEVNLHPDGEGGSEVRVTYELTALSEAGNKDLAHFDASAYAAMLREWEQHIRHAEAEIATYFGK